MKPYSNRTARVDDGRCLYSEIRGGDRARKKAKRKQGRDEIKEELKRVLECPLENQASILQLSERGN
jgi:hypothetical protein